MKIELFFTEMWFDIEIISWNSVLVNSIPDFIKKTKYSRDLFMNTFRYWGTKFYTISNPTRGKKQNICLYCMPVCH